MIYIAKRIVIFKGKRYEVGKELDKNLTQKEIDGLLVDGLIGPKDGVVSVDVKSDIKADVTPESTQTTPAVPGAEVKVG
jgi:hypothetical protein